MPRRIVAIRVVRGATPHQRGGNQASMSRRNLLRLVSLLRRDGPAMAAEPTDKPESELPGAAAGTLDAASDVGILGPAVLFRRLPEPPARAQSPARPLGTPRD
jgi:hypothetical protein